MNGVTIKTRSFPPPERTDDSECSICLESFDSSKRSVTTTECHHTFDSDCLAKWLRHKPNCPLCCKVLSDRGVVCRVSWEVVPEEPLCPICWDCLECPNQPVSVTPCRHSFHSNCLSLWSDRTPAPLCPLCRSPIQRSEAPESRLFLPSSIDSSETEGVCPICRDFLGAEGVIITPCSHYFHNRCLNQWSVRHSSCPSCRGSLLPEPSAAERPPLLTDDRHLENTHCPICLSSVDGNENTLTTACGHDFHVPCLRWFIALRPFEPFCPYCRVPLQVASTRPPMTRDSGYASLSIPDRALSDAANPPAGENTNTAGRGHVVIEIPESDDHEVDSNDVLPTRFIRRRRGRTESCCQIL